MANAIDEIEKQRLYYSRTADKYNAMHVDGMDEHSCGLSFLAASINYLGVKSILDIGSGTGRAIQYIKHHCPGIRIVGVEPVKELRQVGYSQGLTEEELFDGDATKLQFRASEFDLVCEFGVLHHIKRPALAVSEMLRVADKAIFISDSNNFGHGSLLARSVKQIFNCFGLWKFVDFLKTKGKGYTISDGDGIAYSYSVFNNYKLIKSSCKSVHILNTSDAGINPYRTASHVVLLGIKR
ncbi:MAG: methyltransferase domain-containing protein [Candidatus Riflebacteria bacterium]|nr:methyltransferase domain-containing protein [Candidatus Riflebacteria bacterium]